MSTHTIELENGHWVRVVSLAGKVKLSVGYRLPAPEGLPAGNESHSIILDKKQAELLRELLDC